ncbi:hypothetical protein FACS1894159_03550 [Bacteroidia bacterium]|nr:hypothetical protein FACS1894159_03550 [Bacteroidia bacterium]
MGGLASRSLHAYRGMTKAGSLLESLAPKIIAMRLTGVEALNFVGWPNLSNNLCRETVMITQKPCRHRGLS